LTQITPANVTSLKVAWTYHMKPADATRVATTETTPLVVDGVMYLGSPYGYIVALDPVSGKELWSYKLPGNIRPAPRGMGYWPGDKDYAPELLFGTNDGKLAAINVKTGKPAEKFGDNGFVNLRTPEIMRGFDKNYQLTSPPGIFKNPVMTGASNPEDDPRSAVRRPARLGCAHRQAGLTFPCRAARRRIRQRHLAQGCWQNRSGINTWNMMTVDDQRGIAYLPFTGPARLLGRRPPWRQPVRQLVAVDAMASGCGISSWCIMKSGIMTIPPAHAVR
jgi:quinoprotein glucose dehydrogenase